MRMQGFGVAAAALAALGLAACSQAEMDRTNRKLAEAGRNAKQELKEAGRETKAALEKAGDKLAATTDRAVNDNRTPANGGNGSASNSGRVMSDTAITTSIKADFLKDPDLSIFKIDVDTQNGVVTLNGLAGNEEAKQRAAKMASAVKGVKEVRNHLTTKKA